MRFAREKNIYRTPQKDAHVMIKFSESVLCISNLLCAICLYIKYSCFFWFERSNRYSMSGVSVNETDNY